MRFRVAWRDERGSAVAENAMTSVVIVAVFLLVCQFAYAAHVRSSLTMAGPKRPAPALASMGASAPLRRRHATCLPRVPAGTHA